MSTEVRIWPHGYWVNVYVNQETGNRVQGSTIYAAEDQARKAGLRAPSRLHKFLRSEQILVTGEDEE